MKITNLMISNFKNYEGENRFATDVSPHQNVILVGGMNGSGKTSILEAIRLCLYGQRLNGTLMSEKKYEEYVKDMWTHGKERHDMVVALDLTIDEETRPITITICREFRKRKDSFVEQLTITKNGRLVELIDNNYWEHYLRRLIPPEISLYFFFDGEKIRSIITSEVHSNYLLGALKDLTGISELDVLKNDLLEVKKRISRANAKKDILKKIEQFENSISEHNAEIGRIDSEIVALQNERGEYTKDKNHLDIELNRALGTKEEKNNEIKKRIEFLRSKHIEFNESVQECIQSSAHVIICSDIIQKMIERAKKENDRDVFSLSYELIKIRTDAALTEIKRMNLDDEVFSDLATIISEELLRTPEYDERPLIDLTYRQISTLIQEISSKGDEIDDFVSQLRKREDISIEKSKLERELSAYLDQSLGDFETKMNELNSLISEINGRIREKEIKINSLRQEIHTIEKNIKEEDKKMVLSTRDKHAVRIIEDIIYNIEIRTKLQMSESIDLFELNVNAMYSVLKNKKDMVKKIKVDQNMSLHLMGVDKGEVSIEWISEGEKGVLMYSIMYGLVKLSERGIPLIIDSPLGKMDSEHVKKIVSHLYPDIGNQIILLSHDREITKDVVPILDSIISKKYTLMEKPPKIKEGYFE